MATIVCIILLVTIGAMWSYISIQTLRQAYATHFFSNLTLNYVESIKFFSSQHEIVYTKAEKLSNLISKWKLYHYASNAHRYQPRFILQEHNPFNCVITLTDGQEYEFVVALGLPGKADTVYFKLVKPYKNMFFYRITSREYQSPSLYPILQNISNMILQGYFGYFLLESPKYSFIFSCEIPFRFSRSQHSFSSGAGAQEEPSESPFLESRSSSVGQF